MARRLILTLSDEESTALARLARDQFRPEREQVRLLIRREAEKEGVWPVPAKHEKQGARP